MDEIETKYYIRMTVADTHGVLAQIARIFGIKQISVTSVIQKESDQRSQTAELVFMTHLAKELAMQEALAEIGKLKVVKEIVNLVRVQE